MAYIKVNWQAGVTPLSEANMDHLETQYDEAIADIDTATKEKFFPVTFPAGGAAFGNLGDIPVINCLNANEEAYCAIHIPHDFTTIVSAVFIVIPLATQAAANWDLGSDYHAVGEAYNTHNESEVAASYNVTLNQGFEVDISPVLSAIVAGDRGGVRIFPANNAHDLAAVGIRIRYT